MEKRFPAGLFFIFFLPLILSGCGFTEHTAARTSLRPDGKKTTLAVKIVDYNMDHDWPKFLLRRERTERIIRELKSINPDIVFLQEASIVRGDNAAEYIAEKLGFNFVYARANGNDRFIGFEEGEAVITRFPVKGSEVYRLKPKPGVFESRICLRVTLGVPAGLVNVYCTHLSHRAERDVLRYKQAKDLLRFINREKDRGLPVILAGDFNSTPLSGVYRLIKSDGFMDSVLFSGSAFFTSGVDKLDDTKAEPDKRIDFIFLKEGKGNYRWQVSDCYKFFPQPVKFKYRGELENFWVSDHVGIVLNAEFTAE